MTDVVADDTVSPGTLRRIRYAVVLAGVAAAIADWLFYGHAVGISAAILIVLVAAGVAITGSVRLPVSTCLAATAILVASILPIIENASLLSILIGVAGLCVYTLMITGAFSGGVFDRFHSATCLLVSGPYKFCKDVTKIRRSMQGSVNLIAWAVPIGLGLVFLLLFRWANPLIEGWLNELSPAAAVRAIDIKRILFWCLTLGLTWSFFRSRACPWVNRRKATVKDGPAKDGPVEAEPAGVPGTVFGPAAVVRSLIVFNVLFAFQTALDMAYLWGGVALPEGMSYASYAHRGAYPLIIAALLAAAFVLFALRPGGNTERAWLSRALVYLWVGQTILLVVSSILRLNVYVEAYSLTYVRVAAFVWMFLVALGLALIIARIVLRRSNEWLISMNAAALAATLYVCALINFPYVIAAYNVKHSKEATGHGAVLDKPYLCDLGPQALPAIAPYLKSEVEGGSYTRKWDLYYQGCRFLFRRHRDRMADWRAWTYRDWRLSQYLAKHDDMWTR